MILRRWITTIILLLLGSSAHAWTHGAAAPAVVFNINTYGGCGGVDDNAAFAAYKTAALAYQAGHPGDTIELFTPSGVTCKVNNGMQIAAGIKKFIWSGYGTTMAAGSFNIGAGNAAGQLFIHDGGVPTTAYTQTVSAGSTSITLTTNVCALCPGGKFTGLWNVGDWAVITGIDTQGFGYPTGPFYFDYIHITNVNSTTGVITFDAPLKSGYKSTWPIYNPGSGDTSIDQGGPATLYQLGQDWDTEQEYDGMTFADQGSALDSRGRDITFRDATWLSSGSRCINPSQNISWRWIGGSLSTCLIENDKIIGTASYQNVPMHIIDTQTAAIDRFILNNVTVDTSVNGTAKYNQIDNSTIASITFGAGFGRTDEIAISNTRIDALGNYTSGESGVNRAYAMTGGVIAVPSSRHAASAANNGSGAVRLAVDTTGFITPIQVHLEHATGGLSIYDKGDADATVIDSGHLDLIGSTFTSTGTVDVGSLWPPTLWAQPGTNVTLFGRFSGEVVFQVIDVTQDAVGTNIQTSLAGGWPVAPLGTSLTGVSNSNFIIMQHQAPKFTCTNCSGAGMGGMANTPAQQPYGSYSSATITGAAPVFGANVFGALTSASITVSTAYSGTTPALNIDFNSGGFPPFITTIGSTSVTTWGPTVNARTASATPRIMTPTTTSGPQLLDNLIAPGAGTWLVPAQITPEFASVPGDIGSAAATITILTSQGVVNP